MRSRDSLLRALVKEAQVSRNLHALVKCGDVPLRAVTQKEKQKRRQGTAEGVGMEVWLRAAAMQEEERRQGTTGRGGWKVMAVRRPKLELNSTCFSHDVVGK